MSRTARVDAHMHFWKLARGDYGWITPALEPLLRDFGPEDARPHIERAGIDAVVAVQAAPTVAETRFLLEIAAATPFVAGVVGWADMEAADAPDVIARLAADPHLSGLRPMIQDIPNPDWMLRDGLSPAFRAIVELDLRFDALVKPPHLKALARLLERHPDLAVVIDHTAKPEIVAGRFDEWAGEMRALAEGTGAMCKLSGLVTEAAPDWTVEHLRPYVEHLIETFGPDRLMFGSDWPVLTLAGTYEGWWGALGHCLAGLSAPEREAILGGNAVRFYGLAVERTKAGGEKANEKENR